MSPELDPITGSSPATLTTSLLAERLASERALREQEYEAMREALAALKALFDQQTVSDRRALELQAQEYERRLDTLNHAHQAAVEAQAKTVPREMFDQYVKEQQASISARVSAQTEKFGTAIEQLNERVDALVNWRAGIEGRMIGIGAVIGIVVIVINFAIRVL